MIGTEGPLSISKKGNRASLNGGSVRDFGFIFSLKTQFCLA